MNIKFINYPQLMDYTYEHIDKLFVFVCLIKNQFIDIKIEDYHFLTEIGKSKIVLVVWSNRHKVTDHLITLKQCDVSVLHYNSQYIYENYNFVYSQELYDIIPFLKTDKINIVINARIENDWGDIVRLKSDAFIDIIFTPRTVDSEYRHISVKDGVTIVKACWNPVNANYLQIIGNQVYLQI